MDEEISKRKQEIQELKEACKPIVEFLKNKHPHYSVTVDSVSIKLNETVMGAPID
ncbi:MAG: hypothetical protein ACI4XF_05925 [Oscillospiraceae bacterium]